MGMTKDQILEELRKVSFPGYSRDIVSFGLVQDVHLCDGIVKVNIKLVSDGTEIPNKIEQDVKNRLGELPEIKHVEVAVDVTSANQTAPGVGLNPKGEVFLPEVKTTIAVASGKGGVGKSTVAVNLALGLKALGYKVGLMDADVYGPSIPKMLGAEGKQPEVEGNKIIPVEQHGLKLMSLGFLVEDKAPAIWRGPIVSRVITQFLGDVKWGQLDYMIIDLPPGTGDIQLTLVQHAPISSALIVTTPQDVALLDVARANEMFKTVKTPILGIVENMSTYVCPKCEHEEPIFRKGGGAKEAERMGAPLLGEIPLEPAVCHGGDSGEPIVLHKGASKAKEAFNNLANKVSELNVV